MIEPRKVFVSYAHEDKTVADLIAAFLLASGFSVWIDKTRIMPADSITEKIGDGAREAQACVAVLSKAYVASDWCDKELGVFKLLGTRIIGYLTSSEVDVPKDITANLHVHRAEDLPMAIRDVPRSSVREETLGRAGLQNAFRIPFENWRRDERAKQLIQEECGDNPEGAKFYLLANSGFSYIHPKGKVRALVGLGQAIEGGAQVEVVLQSPFSEFALARALTSNTNHHHWDEKVNWKELQEIVSTNNIIVHVTDWPVNCSLFFTKRAAIFDPYLWGLEPPAERPENLFWVFEFRERNVDQYNCYQRLWYHFKFLREHSIPLEKFLEDENSYQTRTDEFEAKLAQIRSCH